MKRWTVAVGVLAIVAVWVPSAGAQGGSLPSVADPVLFQPDTGGSLSPVADPVLFPEPAQQAPEQPTLLGGGLRSPSSAGADPMPFQIDLASPEPAQQVPEPATLLLLGAGLAGLGYAARRCR
jgi:hypothetical protein